MHEEMNMELHGILTTIGYICSFSYVVGSVVLDLMS